MLKSKLSVLCCLALLSVQWSYAGPEWGKTGHRVVGEVAETYLKPSARRAVLKLLNVRNLAEVANFADDIKSDERYRAYDVWHYVNYPLDGTYDESTRDPEGDIIIAIEKCVAVLRDAKASGEDKAFHLKFLIHLIGDLHQPLHIGRKEDKGGNDLQVRWFSNGSNLHRVWDSEMIDSYGMSYSELACSLPVISRAQEKEWQKGSHRDWMTETRLLTLQVYQSAEVGEKLGYRYMYDHFGTVEMQLQKAGLRLAALLNDIF